MTHPDTPCTLCEDTVRPGYYCPECGLHDPTDSELGGEHDPLV